MLSAPKMEMPAAPAPPWSTTMLKLRSSVFSTTAVMRLNPRPLFACYPRPRVREGHAKRLRHTDLKACDALNLYPVDRYPVTNHRVIIIDEQPIANLNVLDVRGIDRRKYGIPGIDGSCDLPRQRGVEVAGRRDDPVIHAVVSESGSGCT